MRSTWVLFRDVPLSIRLLVVNQFGVNVGFYLLLPYLAGYLADDVGLSTALIGLVLGVRNLSQQGLFLIGGTAADRLGARGVIIAGCALRTVGFLLFAIGTSLPLLLTASVLSGLAGGLFNPAVRAYLAHAATDRRTEAFALFNVFASAGALVGPVVGSALLLVDFRVAAIGAATVFAVLTVAQLLALPAQPVPRSDRTVLADWRRCLTDRRFLAFTAALSALFTLQNQLYLVLPVQAERATGEPATVAALFVVGTVATLLLQVPVTRWLTGRLDRGPAIATGLAVTGLAFLVPLVGTVVDGAHPVPAALPVLTAALLLSIGVLMAQPFVLDLVPAFAGARLTGTYFGFFYLVSGVVAAGATVLVGWAVDGAGSGPVPVRAWLLCAGLGLLGAAAVGLLHWQGRLLPASEHRATPEPVAAGGRP